jgi:hypothetical protein
VTDFYNLVIKKSAERELRALPKRLLLDPLNPREIGLLGQPGHRLNQLITWMKRSENSISFLFGTRRRIRQSLGKIELCLSTRRDVFEHGVQNDQNMIFKHDVTLE